MSEPGPSTEAELERFRANWREEVSARNRKPAPSTGSKGNDVKKERRRNVVPPSVVEALSGTRTRGVIDYSEEFEPRSYHDLPNKEEQLRLDSNAHSLEAPKEPNSALEHYEKAVEKETQGQLGDSIKHYQKAFKLDDDVQELYKKKYFPPSSSKGKTAGVNAPNPSVTVANTSSAPIPGLNTAFSTSLKDLLQDFSTFRIDAPPPPTDASPPETSLLGELPEEILIQILESLALTDVASFARLAQVCKRLAYLVMTEQSIWRSVATDDEFGFTAMHYDYACSIHGEPLEIDDDTSWPADSSTPVDDGSQLPLMPEEKALAFSALTEELLHSKYASSWREMLRARPRIRFNGCYISTVNYTRAGASSTNTLTWGTPVHVVTYFRYLRFFRDGTVISLLSTTEPADVVHHITKENLHHHHSNNLPSSVMKDALRGRWRLSGPVSSIRNDATGEPEREGEIHVETDGVVPKYTYKLLLAMSHAGKGARNNKLAWKGFWSYNRLTDDWGEFGLRNDRAFYWSRVRSYTQRPQSNT